MDKGEVMEKQSQLWRKKPDKILKSINLLIDSMISILVAIIIDNPMGIHSLYYIWNSSLIAM